MPPELAALASALVVSAASLVGIWAVPLSEPGVRRVTPLLLALAAGALLGDALLHLLPESLERGGSLGAFAAALAGFVAFDLALRARARGADRSRRVAYLNLAADGVHNFVDGVAIAASFAVGPELGVATTLAVLAHEVPAELGDFGILLYAGFSRGQALALNGLCALSAVAGVLVVIAFGREVDAASGALLAVTAAGFVYVSAVHLLPLVLRRPGRAELASLAGGFGLMLLLLALR
jgi:zinc and cadmium transporter